MNQAIILSLKSFRLRPFMSRYKNYVPKQNIFLFSLEFFGNVERILFHWNLTTFLWREKARLNNENINYVVYDSYLLWLVQAKLRYIDKVKSTEFNNIPHTIKNEQLLVFCRNSSGSDDSPNILFVFLYNQDIYWLPIH